MFNGNNLPHELLLTTRQTIRLTNAFENNIPIDIKLPTVQMSKVIKFGGFLGSLLSKLPGPLMKVAVPYSDSASQTTTLIISNKEMDDIIKIIQALEDSNILLKRVTKTIENETNEQKRGFLGMLLGILRVSLLGNMLTGKGMLRTDYGHKKGKGIVRAAYGNKMDF